MRQQAGRIDRIFNSTISLPQQVIWRIIRAARDDDTLGTLFSERGLLDFALVPGLGMADDHRHDVMPDYMAETMGFDPGLKGELTASILSDPLTWLTGGASSAAKGAKAAVRLGRMKDTVGKSILEGAKVAGKTSREFFEGMTVNDLRNIAGQHGNDPKVLRLLGDLSEARSGFKDTDLIKDIIGKTSDRKLAIGLPGLSNLGIKIDIDSAHKSWWDMATSGGKWAADKSGVSFATRTLVSTPWVRPIAEVPRQFAGGWSVGKNARAAIADADKALGTKDAAQLASWLDPQRGGRLLPTLGQVDPEKMVAHFDNLVKQDLPTRDIVESTLRKFGGKELQEDSFETIWKKLHGRGVDDDALRIAIPKDPARALEFMLKKVQTGISKHAKASAKISPGDLSSYLRRSEAGRLADAFTNDRKTLKYAEGLARQAFDLGAASKAALNKFFRTGTETTVASKAYEQFLGKTAAAQDQVSQMGKMVYRKLESALKEMPGATADDVNKLLFNLMEATPLESELAAAAQLGKGNAKDAMRVVAGLERFAQRHHASMRAIEEVLKSSSIPQNVRDTISSTLEAEVFAFLPTFDEGRLAAHFDRLIEVQKGLPKLEFGPAATKRMKRAHNRHTLGGTDSAGRQVGTLTDDEISKALGEIEGTAQRSYNPKEIATAIAEDPSLSAFKRKHGLTDSELINVIQRRGKSQTRVVKRVEPAEMPLWKEGRTSWTSSQASQALDPYKLSIAATDEGYILTHFGGLSAKSLRNRGFKVGTLGKKGWSNTYGTIDELMADVRGALDANPGYRQKHGPDLVPTKRDIVIDATELDTLRRAIGDDTYDIIRGKATRFDEELLPGYAGKLSDRSADALDYRRLSTARERREFTKKYNLKEDNPSFDGINIGKEIEGPRTISSPRRVSEDDIFFEELTKAGDDVEFAGDGVRQVKNLSQWARSYGRARMTLHELQQYVTKATRAGITPDIPPELLDDISFAMSDMSTLINDAVLEALPKGGRQVMYSLRKMQNAVFDASKRSGVFMPGSPVAYLGRFFTKAGRERMRRVMGEIDNAELDNLKRLGMRTPSRFGRSTDHMTVDQLNEVHTWLREATASGDPKAKAWFDEIESVMKEEGIVYRGYKGKLPWSDDRVNNDPVLSLLMRLNHANQDVNIEEYFGRFLAASGEAPGESLAIGGRVVSILDDAGNQIDQAFMRSRVRQKNNPAAVKAAEAGVDGGPVATKTISEVEEVESVVPKYALVEADDGKRHLMPLAYMEDGFGALSLGRAQSLDTGYQSTTAKAFVHASMSDELKNTWMSGRQLADNPYNLVGNHVVFGSEHTIKGAVSTAQRTMQVSAGAWRTLDTANFMIKSFQTVFRLPFQAYNLASGIFQAQMAGVGARNLTAAYADTVKMLWGDTRFIKQTEMLDDLLDVAGSTHSGFTLLPHNDVVDAIRRMGGRVGSKIDPADIERLGLNKLPNGVLRVGKDETISMAEFMEAAADHHLFGTFASSLARGSRTVSDSLVAMKMATLNPDMLEGTLKKTADSLIEGLGGTAGELRETGEVINRMSTAIGLLREGHPLDRAMQMAKNAHVPYEKLTPFERDFAKRIISYYTFPRHYMPWAWAKFMEDPKKLGNIVNVIKNQKIMTTEEGQASIKLGDYRVSAGRLNANFEAALMLGAFADRYALPMVRTIPGVKGMAAGDNESLVPYDPNILSKAMGMSGLTSKGGIASLVFGSGELLPQGRREAFGNQDSLEEARNMIWPIKAFFAGMRATGFDTDYTTKEEQTPYVDYTDMERFISDNDFGLGVRKVAPKAELRRAYYEYQQLYREMKLKIAATDDETKRQRYIGNIRVLAHTLKGIAAASMQ
jgi:hypothetical protein